MDATQIHGINAWSKDFLSRCDKKIAKKKTVGTQYHIIIFNLNPLITNTITHLGPYSEFGAFYTRQWCLKKKILSNLSTHNSFKRQSEMFYHKEFFWKKVEQNRTCILEFSPLNLIISMHNTQICIYQHNA